MSILSAEALLKTIATQATAAIGDECVLLWRRESTGFRLVVCREGSAQYHSGAVRLDEVPPSLRLCGRVHLEVFEALSARDLERLPYDCQPVRLTLLTPNGVIPALFRCYYVLPINDALAADDRLEGDLEVADLEIEGVELLGYSRKNDGQGLYRLPHPQTHHQEIMIKLSSW